MSLIVCCFQNSWSPASHADIDYPCELQSIVPCTESISCARPSPFFMPGRKTSQQLEALQAYLKWLVSLQTWCRLMQLPIVIALLLRWLLIAHGAPGFQTVSFIFFRTIGPLAEIALLLALVGMLLGACVSIIAGPYVAHWSHHSVSMASLAKNIFACAALARFANKAPARKAGQLSTS
jgi:hypothetical protein